MGVMPPLRRRPRFTIEPNPHGSLWIFLSSGDGEEYPDCRLSIAAFGKYVGVRLPPIIRPERKKVYSASWDAATIARLGRDWYWDYTERQYGVSLCDNHLSIKYGRQAHDSSVDQQWGCFLPWREWRFVRRSLYDVSGEHFFTEWARDRRRGMHGFDAMRAAEEATPKWNFMFADFDGEVIEATTLIEEREWHRGTGWFKWLSWFYSPKVRRSLDIKFSKETGRRKGSWKGGTVGHGIDLLPGETHIAAFARYCAQHEMKML